MLAVCSDDGDICTVADAKDAAPSSADQRATVIVALIVIVAEGLNVDKAFSECCVEAYKDPQGSNSRDRAGADVADSVLIIMNLLDLDRLPFGFLGDNLALRGKIADAREAFIQLIGAILAEFAPRYLLQDTLGKKVGVAPDG